MTIRLWGAVGYNALGDNDTGSGNTTIGASAGDRITGNNNIAIGYLSSSAEPSGYSGDNNIIIGTNAEPSSTTVSNEIRLGNSSITSARIQVPWTITSDLRWKENIAPSKLGLAFLMNLEAVEYNRQNAENYSKEIGFIAQDVAKLLKTSNRNGYGLLNQDGNGYYELRYNDFIAIMVKALQEQQTLIEE